MKVLDTVEPGQLVTVDLAKLLQIHPYSVGLKFKSSCVGRLRKTSTKVWSLDRVAAAISAASEQDVSAEQLSELVTRNQASDLLGEQGAPRNTWSFCYWKQLGTGPHIYRIGALARYRKSEVIAWIDQLPSRGLPLPMRKAQTRRDPAKYRRGARKAVQA